VVFFFNGMAFGFKRGGTDLGAALQHADYRHRVERRWHGGFAPTDWGLSPGWCHQALLGYARVGNMPMQIKDLDAFDMRFSVGMLRAK
jgi:hypothetical protein